MINLIMPMVGFLYSWYIIVVLVSRWADKDVKQHSQTNEEFIKEYPFSDKKFFIKSALIPFYAIVVGIKNLF